LIKGYQYCRAGATITALSENFRQELEPGTVTYGKRIELLKNLKEAGVSTYLSIEPIMPVAEANPIEIIQQTKDFVDLYEFGKWSKYRYRHLPPHYWENYSDKYYLDLFIATMKYCDDNKINYCIATHSKKFFDKYGLLFKMPNKPQPLNPRVIHTQTDLSSFD
jgi:DNA repair photolyase